MLKTLSSLKMSSLGASIVITEAGTGDDLIISGLDEIKHGHGTLGDTFCLLILERY